MHREFELKVELTKSDVERLIGTDGAAGIGIGPANTKRLRSIYYDTTEHDLHARGVSLRVRRQDGAWVQTVKADQRLRGGVSNPVELEAPLDGPEPEVSKISNKKIRRLVQHAVKEGGLEPVFETIVRRTTRPIKTGGSELELAVDDGEVRVDGKSQDLREAELELKAGSAQGLLVAADTCWDRYPSSSAPVARQSAGTALRSAK
jgi:triphosphatase